MRPFALLIVSLALAGCASTGGGDPRDPWEGLNRKTFAFNDVLDRAVLKPVAQGYEKVVPTFAREGVNNFYSNIEDIATPLGLEKHDEDFGQTLGWWGVPPGPYFVVPFLGPSTVRDAPAKAVDPSVFYNDYLPDRAYWSWWGLDKVRTRAN